MADDLVKQMLDAFENLSEEEFGYAKDEFDDIDTDGSGTISTEELTAYLMADGGISEDEVTKHIAKYDFDGDGTVTLQEFLQASGYKLKPSKLVFDISALPDN